MPPETNPMPEQVQASVSEPTPIPPRPTMYVVLYPNAGGATNGWNTGYPRNTIAECEQMRDGHPGSVIVTIPASPTPSARPEQPKACGEIGEGWLPLGMGTVAERAWKEVPDARFNHGAMLALSNTDRIWRTYIRSLTKPKPQPQQQERDWRAECFVERAAPPSEYNRRYWRVRSPTGAYSLQDGRTDGDNAPWYKEPSGTARYWTVEAEARAALAKAPRPPDIQPEPPKNNEDGWLDLRPGEGSLEYQSRTGVALTGTTRPTETQPKPPEGDKELDALMKRMQDAYHGAKGAGFAKINKIDALNLINSLNDLRQERDEAVRMQAELRIKLSVCEGERDDERSRHALALLAARTEHVLKCPICTGDSVRLKEENAALSAKLAELEEGKGETINTPVQDDLLKRLDEAGRKGLDGSPGDELAAEAASHIRVQNTIIKVLRTPTSPPAPQEPKPCVTCGHPKASHNFPVKMGEGSYCLEYVPPPASSPSPETKPMTITQTPTGISVGPRPCTCNRNHAEDDEHAPWCGGPPPQPTGEEKRVRRFQHKVDPDMLWVGTSETGAWHARDGTVEPSRYRVEAFVHDTNYTEVFDAPQTPPEQRAKEQVQP